MVEQIRDSALLLFFFCFIIADCLSSLRFRRTGIEMDIQLHTRLCFQSQRSRILARLFIRSGKRYMYCKRCRTARQHNVVLFGAPFGHIHIPCTFRTRFFRDYRQLKMARISSRVKTLTVVQVRLSCNGYSLIELTATVNFRRRSKANTIECRIEVIPTDIGIPFLHRRRHIKTIFTESQVSTTIRVRPSRKITSIVCTRINFVKMRISATNSSRGVGLCVSVCTVFVMKDCIFHIHFSHIYRDLTTTTRN